MVTNQSNQIRLLKLRNYEKIENATHAAIWFAHWIQWNALELLGTRANNNVVAVAIVHTVMYNVSKST